MAFSALLSCHPVLPRGTTFSFVCSSSASPVTSVRGCRVGFRLSRTLPRLRSANEEHRPLVVGERECVGTILRFREGWDIRDQERLRKSRSRNNGKRCCIQAKLRVHCSFWEREDGEGFRQGLRSGKLQQLQRWRNYSWNGDRAEVQAMARTEQRRNFLSGEGEAGEGEEFISVPLIGELPVTLGELRSVFTPMKILVWAVIATVVWSLWGIVSSLTFYNPAFWLYSSWIFIKWPWPAAILVGIASLRTAFQVSTRQPKEWEQIFLLLGSLTWLILVPLGCFHGFVDGWPLILFVVYNAFFVISAVARYRLYRNLEVPDKDKQWETVPSRVWKVGFVVCVVAGHWLAAYEAPFLLLSWNLEWGSILAILTIAVAGLTHYSAAYFLGKYFDRLVQPVAVVMFGPYRIVRHPIYASYMLLFSGYCLALRSYISCLFLLISCIVYYEQRTRLEEDMLIETFGNLYRSYKERVPKKYFPFFY